MQRLIRNAVLIALGWFFVVLGIIGAFLPLLPTTPFLILALILFAESSPRFHRMLLDNRWFGPGLRQWEREKTVARSTKRKATLLIVITFTLSILLLHGRVELQLMLMALMTILLVFIWRLAEPDEPSGKD